MLYSVYNYFKLITKNLYFNIRLLQHCRSATFHKNVYLFPSAKIDNIQGNSKSIVIENNTSVLGQLLIFAHSGSIELGDSCYIGEGARIWSASKICIGNRVLISHGVNIHDTDGHPLEKTERHRHAMQIITHSHPQNDISIPSLPIFIRDDVWIGFNAIILKGVEIGEGTIVGAGSVVTKSMPANCVVAGNPARVVKYL